jgi:hypothetical protein
MPCPQPRPRHQPLETASPPGFSLEPVHFLNVGHARASSSIGVELLIPRIAFAPNCVRPKLRVRDCTKQSPHLCTFWTPSRINIMQHDPVLAVEGSRRFSAYAVHALILQLRQECLHVILTTARIAPGIRTSCSQSHHNQEDEKLGLLIALQVQAPCERLR